MLYAKVTTRHHASHRSVVYDTHNVKTYTLQQRTFAHAQSTSRDYLLALGAVKTCLVVGVAERRDDLALDVLTARRAFRAEQTLVVVAAVELVVLHEEAARRQLPLARCDKIEYTL